VIRTGGPGLSALDVAGELLAELGSLSALAAARFEQLDSANHLGWAKAAGLVAAFELGRRAAAVGDSRSLIRGPADLAQVVEPLLRNKPQEEVLVVVMNGASRVTKIVPLSNGAANRCLMLPRDVLAAVFRNDGLVFGVAHNHPSGEPNPSGEDIAATRALAEAAQVAGLRFVDHIIIGTGAWVSLRDRQGFA
jgi:DNA repair protein RadC